jgi:hypothetical protein
MSWTWVWLLTACSPVETVIPVAGDERTLKLVYTADVHGEIEPCG